MEFSLLLAVVLGATVALLLSQRTNPGRRLVFTIIGIGVILVLFASEGFPLRTWIPISIIIFTSLGIRVWQYLSWRRE